MAWCNETSEIHKKINKYQNSTNNMDNLNNYKRDENLVNYDDRSYNTLNNFKAYLQHTIIYELI
ncbi:hypothetical protein U3516DRAFT_761206 [Neocallimastix sp. 'constans']